MRKLQEEFVLLSYLGLAEVRAAVMSIWRRFGNRFPK